MGGFMEGIMQKANAVKGAVAEKAGGLGAGNLQGFGGGTEGQEQQLQEGQEGGYVEGGQEGMEGGDPAASMGFAAGLMMKAHSLKEGVKEKGAAINLGNVQSMAGGVIGQVQGLIPGMKREEDVPDPAPRAEGEYAEYTEEQYAEHGYTEEQYTE